METLYMEQFVYVVGEPVHSWIRKHKPTTLEQAVELAEEVYQPTQNPL